MNNTFRRFTVQGKPFLSIGAQTHNSSSYFLDNLDDAFAAIKLVHGNTIATPVPWDAFEPEEGKFNDSFVTNLIDRARAEGIHLVLLWFGTWKNATMEYTPAWVKCDKERFPRVLCHEGTAIANLTAHCPTNMEADARAFCHLMQVLKDYDGDTNTVIAVQIENEPGTIGGTRRDFGPYGEADWQKDVPEEIMEYARTKEGTRLNRAWKRFGCKEGGKWWEVFDFYGAEGFTSYYIARYIDEIARRAKEVYDIFLYINVALDGGERDNGFGVMGIDNFGGGAQTKNVDLWYCTCKYLDAIAPDIYHADQQRHDEMIETYAHPDKGWPLYVPESSFTDSVNNAQMFYAFGSKKCIGYHFFGLESRLRKDGTLDETGQMYARTFRMIDRVAPLIFEYQDKGEGMYPIKQYCAQSDYLIELNGWKCRVCFNGPGYSWNAMDYRHQDAINEEGKHLHDYQAERGRGFIFQVAENEFYIVGHGCRLLFARYEPLDGHLSPIFVNTRHHNNNTEYVTVTEGEFDSEGNYVANRVRSGDELRQGVWLQEDCGVLHLVLCP